MPRIIFASGYQQIDTVDRLCDSFLRNFMAKISIIALEPDILGLIYAEHAPALTQLADGDTPGRFATTIE